MKKKTMLIILILFSSFTIICKKPMDQEDGDTVIIAYAITESNGNAQIYTINSERSGKTRLPNESNRLYGPAYSPDATKMAFYTHFNNQTWSLYWMNSDGTGIHQLTNTINVLDWSPDWSSDASKIVFARS